MNFIFEKFEQCSLFDAGMKRALIARTQRAHFATRGLAASFFATPQSHYVIARRIGDT